MSIPTIRAELSNWSKSAHSPCLIAPVRSAAEIAGVLASARDQRLTVIPHGAGHSYTDAALNTNGLVLDLRPMRRILSWNPVTGIIRVEPGATVREVVETTWKDGWWPAALPSTPEVTMGGCAAMNVNGKDSWKCGSFGEQILSVEVMLASGEVCTLSANKDAQLFCAVIGSLGVLGIIISLTIQLQRISSGFVAMSSQRAASFTELFALFAEEEQRSDFMEAWLDGFAGGPQLGRGILNSAVMVEREERRPSPFPARDRGINRLENRLVPLAAILARPVVRPGVQMVNRAYYAWNRKMTSREVDLPTYTFWPPAAFAGYHALFANGVETFQAFVPEGQAQECFACVLRYSQEQACWPLWCVIKRHRRDPFLLSYQVDGFSLELNYARASRSNGALLQALQHMVAMILEVGGRFYLAKDHFLTHDQYRQSAGADVVERFLQLKRRYDPELLLQSDLYRRVFAPGHV